MMVKQMAPGTNRAFAFMGWPAFREGRWAFLKHDAQKQAVDLDQPLIFASDIQADSCERLAGNIAASGLSDAVRVAQKDVFQCEANQYKGGPGLVAINPPYGIRIGSTRQADDLFKDICRHLAYRFKDWKIALIAPRRELAAQLPFAARRLSLLHGGLKLTLVMGTIK
jgi:putative N6-adenine-specific DNA methylase